MNTQILSGDALPQPGPAVPGAKTVQDAVAFGLLGPVEARLGGQVIDAGEPRQRCVLAVLLLDANHCVSADQILDRAWGGRRLPVSPRNAVQQHLCVLRKRLSGTRGLAIVRQPDGYMARIDPRFVDVHLFRLLIRHARLSRRDDVAMAQFERALALWRGEAFGLLDTPWLSGVRSVLDRERLQAERDLTDIQLRQGQHDMLLARLAGWAAEHPLDERLAGQLMLALYRGGRQAEALEHYQHCRGVLAEELGIDAGPVLQELHQRILTADPGLARGASLTAGSRADWPSPGCAFSHRSGLRCLQRLR